MDREKFKANVEFDKKIRLAGAVCSAVCIVIRQIFFSGSSIPAPIMLIPLVLALIFGFCRMLSISPDYLEKSMEDCKKDLQDFEEEHKILSMAASLCSAADFIAAIVITVFGW